MPARRYCGGAFGVLLPFGPVADVVLPLCPLDLLDTLDPLDPLDALDPLDRFEALPVVPLLPDAFLRGLYTGMPMGPSDTEFV